MLAVTSREETDLALFEQSRFAYPRRDYTAENSRPENRLAGEKTAPRKIFSVTPVLHQEPLPQTLGTHQENSVFFGTIVLGCVVAPNNADSTQLSDFTYNGLHRHGVQQGVADDKLRTAVSSAIDNINDRLTRKMLNPNSAISNSAIDAWLDFNTRLSKYADKITIQEIAGAPGRGGATRSGSRGQLLWDPSYVYKDKRGLVSDPIVIFGHEMTHVLDGMELAPRLKDFLMNTDSGPLDNLWEVRAIDFENMLRSGPPRTYHNPDKNW
jgi:hypothetical protein